MKTMFTSTSIQNVDSKLKVFFLSPTCLRSKCGSGSIINAEEMSNETLELCFDRGNLD